MLEQSQIKELGIPLLSVTIALAGVLSGYILNSWTVEAQSTLKIFEVTFPEKQKGYARLMGLLSDSFYSAAWQQQESHYKFLDSLEDNYFELEPYLSACNRERAWAAIQEFTSFCDTIHWADPGTDMEIELASDEFTKHRDNIRALLFPDLFERK